MKLKISILACTLSLFMIASSVHGEDKPASHGTASPHGSMGAETDGGLITGKVLETMDSGGYTYVRVEKDGKKIWLAMPQTKVQKGKTMSFTSGGKMINFESKTLKRTFSEIIFSGGPVIKAGVTGASSGSKNKVINITDQIKIEKASGANAYTIAELYKNKVRLDKKEVVVRGKVVKVSGGIMGKNWIHIQDGTGNRKKATNDLVVTSDDKPTVGDTITATGVLSKDKDFGGGYKYDLIIENAGLVPY
ncbi:MAG: DNA-binding protein [Nitrospirae bacterium]|nr:MAG: DNA-binding protein [Nitrospirota bacterium]